MVQAMWIVIFPQLVKKFRHRTLIKLPLPEERPGAPVSYYSVFLFLCDQRRLGVRGGAVGCGTALHGGRKRVRFPMDTMALGDRLSLYQGYLLGVKAVGA